MPDDKPDKPFDYGKTKENGQHERYPTMDKENKEFVRPVRQTYFHDRCRTNTSMGVKIAETYAKNPKYYGSTFCVACGGHFPVGENGEFVWVDDPGTGKPTEEKVGT